MARFGLSPYSNPVEAGIDAFAKVTGVFQNMDKMKMDKESLEMERQDKAQHRQLVDVEMQEKTQDIEMKKQKFKEEVEKAGKLREEDQREAEVVDKINKAGLKGSEAQNTYYTEMRKAGTIKTAKELKEGSGVLFKVPKLTGHIVPDDNSDTGFSFLTEEQGLVPGAPDPDARVNKQITALGERQDKELRAMGARQDKTIAAQSALVDKKESIKEKKDDSEKKGEKLKKDIETRLYHDPAWKDRPNEEVDAEVERQYKLKSEGKPVTKSEASSKISPLVDKFKSLNANEHDIPYTVESAAKKWPEADVRAAAKQSGKKAVQDAVAGYYSNHPGAKPQTRKAIATSESMPDATKYSGKHLTDHQTGKEYKSDGKKWVETKGS